MKSNMRLPGPFAAHEVAPGTWRLVNEAAAQAEVWVRGAPGLEAALQGAGGIESLEVDWREQSARLTLCCGGRPRPLEARSVIVHQPQGTLYAALPLPAFDARARRFWRRIFTLVRIPGGRALLGLIARRRRA